MLPAPDDAQTYRVRIFTPRTELNFAGHPTIGTACALVMHRHAGAVGPVRLTLEENIGPVTVDVTRRHGGYHGTLTLSATVEMPAGTPAPADLATVLSLEPGEVRHAFFASVGLPFCFVQLTSNAAVDRAVIDRAAWAATLQRAWAPHVFFFAGELRDRGTLYARMCAPALGVEEELAHTSLRIGFGRFTTEAEVDYAADRIVAAVQKLREMSPLWEMAQEGIDLKSIEWAAH
mgnify:CR=1 FL=1